MAADTLTTMHRGDVVVMRSGGPAMTVEQEPNGTRIACVWFDEFGHLQRSDAFLAWSLRALTADETANYGPRRMGRGY